MSGPLDPRALLTDLLVRPGEALTRHGPQVPELRALRGCPQPPNNHSEGDVWTHTALALAAWTDLPRAVDREAGGALEAAGVEVTLPSRSLTQAVTVLLHDVAKPVTIAGEEGAWTYHGHDAVGADLAVTLLDRYDLVAAAVDLGHTLDPAAVAWLIREHLFWLTTDLERVTDRAVARRFVRNDGWDEDLRVLSWCDTLGSRGPDGRPYVDLLVGAEARLAAARARARAAAARPARPLGGRELMALLDIDEGPRVGAVLRWVDRQGVRDHDHARALVLAQRERLRAAPTQVLLADTPAPDRPGGRAAGDAAEGSFVDAACGTQPASPRGAACCAPIL